MVFLRVGTMIKLRFYLFFKPCMVFSMFGIAGKKHKIFNSIIVFNSVNVMNMFIRRYKSAYLFLHNKSVFINVTAVPSKWVFWTIYLYISGRMFSSTTPPVPMKFSRIVSFKPLIPRFFTFSKRIFFYMVFSVRPITFARTKSSYIFAILCKEIRTIFTCFYLHRYIIHKRI